MKNLKAVTDPASDGLRVNPFADHDAVRIGQRLVEMGKIAEHDIPRIVIKQRERGLRFGEAAVGLGLLTSDELRRALSAQYAYPYVEVGGSLISPELVTAHRPFDAQSEVFRALRSQLSLRWFKDRHKTITVAAPRSGGGASTIAANLAVSFAQLGQRTLLIDANFRTPRQHVLFGLQAGGGLSSVLTGRCAPHESLNVVAPFEHLAVMCSGPAPPNPQELLSRAGFAYLLETAPTTHDVIIVDAPPLLEYSDAQIIVAITGACLLVTRRHSTRIADIESAQRYISPTGASVIGTVING